MDRKKKLARLKAAKLKSRVAEDRVTMVLNADGVFAKLNETLAQINEFLGIAQAENKMTAEQTFKYLKPFESLKPEFEKINEALKVIQSKDAPTSVRVKNLDDLIEAIEKQGKFPNWLDKTLFSNITDSLQVISKQLEDQEVRLKPGQRMQDFIPVRRVIKIGRQYYWDDSVHAGSSGGGNIPTVAATGHGGIDAVPVVNPDGSDISAGGGGGAVTIADGADVAEGATTDAVVAAGAAGTVSAKLRRLTTDLADIPNVIGTDGAAGPTKALSVAGTQSTGELQEVQVDSDGQLQVDVLTLPSITIGTFPDNEPFNVAQWGGNSATAGAGAVAAGTPRVTLASDDPAVASLAILDDWDESDRAKVNPIAGQAGVQGASGVVTALTQRVVLATDVALPAGTNAIGKLAANSGVDIGDVTLTAGTDAIGKLLPPDVDVTAHTNYIKKYYTSTGAATDGIVWSPAAGKRWHVVSMFVNVSAAATVTFEDDLAAGDSAVMKMELAANSGYTINFGEKYPLASGEDAADLLVTTSAGNIYITVTGYEI